MMLDWLLAPMDATRVHDVQAAVIWHARLMTLAWGFIVPCGILAARFLKLWPGQKWPETLDHPGWWHLHRLCQYLAAAITLIALYQVLNWHGRSGADRTHMLMGWSVIALTLLQVSSGWLRGSKGGPTAPGADGSWRGDHYDMTMRRIVFEYIHKIGGYLALFLAIGAVFSGLWQTNAPRWMAIGVSSWWIICLVMFVLLQRRGHAFDTYQAHWGPEAVHPGNRRPPVGLGVRRTKPS